MTARFWAIVLIVVLAVAAPALAQEPSAAGRIKIVSGSAFIVRDGGPIRALVGQTVLESDVLKTAADGRIGVTLRDDTRVSLGPNSEVRLDQFLYAPSEGSLGLVLKIVRGMAAYVSGQIAKLSPDAVRLETPAAIVGVRGTSLAIRVEP